MERMDKGVTTSTAGELFGTNDFRDRGTLGSGTLNNGTFLTENLRGTVRGHLRPWPAGPAGAYLR